MNLLTTKKIVIPDGEVEKIFDKSGNVLWTKPYVYGVTWDKSSSATMTRTDDAVNFAAPTVGNGTTTGSSAYDNCYPWKEIKKVTDGNNILVSIPRFWYKWTDTTSTLTLQIANCPLEGYHTSPLHADRGDGKGEREIAYIARYKSANSTYYSKSGVVPQVSMTRATARSKIAALGTGYYQFDYSAFWTLRMLFLVEFATWDGIGLFNMGTRESGTDALTGGTDSMTYHTGVGTNGYSMQYRYIENPWSDVLEWCDGIYLSGSNVYCINNPTKFSDTSNGTLVATAPSSYGFIKTWTMPTASGYEYALFPKTISSSGYIPDYVYTDIGTGTVVYTGGGRSLLSQHGPFFIYCDFTATSTSSVIASRAMKLV